jgi:acetyl esterase/lipase
MDPALFPSLDPELEGMVRVLPDLGSSLDDLDEARAMLAEMAPLVADVDTTGLDVQDVPLDDFGSPASARVYRPAGVDTALPGLVFIHGGGFVLGNVDLEHQTCVDLARDLGIVVASVEYRLAPEHPYPAGLEDCYAALRLLAGLPGVDPARVAVHGQSAGGGLSAGLALLARDRGGPALCFQSLDVPVIDDRLETPSMRSAGPWLMWSPSQAATSWRLYLDGRPADQYAAPGRAEDLSGLPPAYVVTCELDPLRDEGNDYATRLMAAGVTVELHCWPGTFHGVQLVPDAAVVKRMNAERVGVLGRALGVAAS